MYRNRSFLIAAILPENRLVLHAIPVGKRPFYTCLVLHAILNGFRLVLQQY
jgi:hypothetical protein